MLKDIVGKVFNNKQFKGTCFILNENYGVTARHVLKQKTEDACFKTVKCTFNCLDREADVIYENEEYDFAILKFREKIFLDSEVFKIAQTAIEEGDKWKSRGYPIYNSNGVTVNGDVDGVNDNDRYELYIRNQRDVSDWSGISGAPLIIEDEIAGILIEQEKGGNLKNKLEVVDIISIMKQINKDKPELIDNLKQGYHPLLKARLKNLSMVCEEIFYSEQAIKDESIINYHIFKNNNKSVESLYIYIEGMLEEYGTDLVSQNRCKNAKDLELIKIKRDIMKKRSHIINLIKNESHLVHILIWILLEANGNPRIGSYIVDKESRISRDIFINKDEIKLIIGNGRLDKDIILSIEKALEGLDNIKSNIGRNIFISDELVVNSLPNNISSIIKPGLLKRIGNNEITIDIYILVTFDCKDVFYEELNNDEKIYYTKNHIEEYIIDIKKIVDKYVWLKNINIHWTFIPFEDIDIFNNTFKRDIV